MMLNANEWISSVTMLMLMMMNDSDIALKFKATIHIPFVLGQIIVLIIHLRPNIQDPLFA